jgi:hypothetical protein
LPKIIQDRYVPRLFKKNHKIPIRFLFWEVMVI